MHALCCLWWCVCTSHTQVMSKTTIHHSKHQWLKCTGFKCWHANEEHFAQPHDWKCWKGWVTVPGPCTIPYNVCTGTSLVLSLCYITILVILHISTKFINRFPLKVQNVTILDEDDKPRFYVTQLNESELLSSTSWKYNQCTKPENLGQTVEIRKIVVAIKSLKFVAISNVLFVTK